MFTRFCGFGPGHKSTHCVTKVFRDEIKEAFGLGTEDMGDTFEASQPRAREHASADEKDFEDASDGDSDLEDSESSEPEGSEVDLWNDDRDDLEEELGYAPL